MKSLTAVSSTQKQNPTQAQINLLCARKKAEVPRRHVSIYYVMDPYASERVQTKAKGGGKSSSSKPKSGGGNGGGSGGSGANEKLDEHAIMKKLFSTNCDSDSSTPLSAFSFQASTSLLCFSPSLIVRVQSLEPEHLPMPAWNSWRRQLLDDSHASYENPPLDVLRMANLKDHGNGKFGAQISAALASGAAPPLPPAAAVAAAHQAPIAPMLRAPELDAVPVTVFITPDDSLHPAEPSMLVAQANETVAALKNRYSVALAAQEVELAPCDLLFKAQNMRIEDLATISAIALANGGNGKLLRLAASANYLKVKVTVSAEIHVSLTLTLSFSRKSELTFGCLHSKISTDQHFPMARTLQLLVGGFLVTDLSSALQLDGSELSARLKPVA